MGSAMGCCPATPGDSSSELRVATGEKYGNATLRTEGGKEIIDLTVILDACVRQWAKVETTGPSEEPVKLEDSNMALIGSDQDKAARKTAALKEPAWKGLPPRSVEPSVRVWRIEKFKVVPYPQADYGTFYRGDSYIVLHTYKEPESDKLLYDLHFWIGSESTQDEYGTAAYKTVELDDLMDGLPVQYRECEGMESERFQSYFPQGLRYESGGVDSGFRRVQPEEYKPRLLWVRKCKQSMRILEVPKKTDSLNEGDCFVLDAGTRIWVWHGASASPFEKNAAATEGHRIKEQRLGKASCTLLEHDGDDEFWAALGGRTPIAGVVDRDPEPANGEGILWRLTDANQKLELREVARGNVHKGMLNSEDVFLMDADSALFVWIGNKASGVERRNAFPTCEKYLTIKKKNLQTPVCVLTEGQPIKSSIWLDMMKN